MVQKPEPGSSSPEPRDVAVVRLVEEYGDKLFALGLRLCGDRERAQDLVQETFLRAYRKWDQFEGRSKPSTWLYSIAVRVAQRMQRRKSGEPHKLMSLDDLMPFDDESIAVVPDERDGPFAHELVDEARTLVERALAGLPEPYRVPFVLKEIGGLSLRDVGAILGIKEKTVKTRLHRARLQARHSIERALPKRKVPFAIFSKQVCMDLLRAKQDSLDRGLTFSFPDEVVCERCAELFATLDLTQEACRLIAEGRLPESVRNQVLGRIARNEGTSAAVRTPRRGKGSTRAGLPRRTP